MNLSYVLEIVFRPPPSRPPDVSRQATVQALNLLLKVRDLASLADQEGRDYIAWRIGQISNDVYHLADRRPARPAPAGTAVPPRSELPWAA